MAIGGGNVPIFCQTPRKHDKKKNTFKSSDGIRISPKRWLSAALHLGDVRVVADVLPGNFCFCVIEYSPALYL